MSIPVKVLYDAVGMEVSLEVTNGEVYHGILGEVQDTMNVTLNNASKITKKGDKHTYGSIFIRGSTIVFFQLPDKLQLSPALLTANKVIPKAMDGRGQGKGFGRQVAKQN